MKVLVINTGSSSIKFQLFNMIDESVLISGLVERIGDDHSKINFDIGGVKSSFEEKIKNHQAGLERVVNILIDPSRKLISSKLDIKVCGHRTVHGGDQFCLPTLVNGEVLKTIKEMIPLAPLHNPANIKGIEVASEIFPDASQVAIFDTAFHQSMPDYAYRYALPKEMYERLHVRRYGFHGTSHFFVAKKSAEFLKISFENFSCITIHLGNGASMAAIKNGKSIDTTMGMTPLEGLIMGTRAGDLDPAIPHYLVSRDNLNIDGVNVVLNKKSGLLGITGKSDIRDIQNGYLEGDDDSRLALEMSAYRIKKYIGAYTAVIGKIDAIIFTAGIGENSSILRQMICKDMNHIGIELDQNLNETNGSGVRLIGSKDAQINLLITPTNEELEIARQSLEVYKSLSY